MKAFKFKNAETAQAYQAKREAATAKRKAAHIERLTAAAQKHGPASIYAEMLAETLAK